MTTMEGIYLSSASYLLLVSLGMVLTGFVASRWLKTNKKNTAPGPQPWPLIGSLHLLAGYELPYQAFDVLNKKYGPVVSLRLGQVDCIVVSSYEYVKEVLVNKGEHFDGRPNFCRINDLFGGEKENSLAFSDWSELQKYRREILRDHTFPRPFSSKFNQLESLINKEMLEVYQQLDNGVTDIKTVILKSCANLFLKYFTSTRFDREDPSFVKFVKNFDEVFYEVNQGYIIDFIPWFKPLYINMRAKMTKCSTEIREFISSKVLNYGKPGDLLTALLESSEEGALTKETALYALEDIIGGHTAIGSFIIKVLGYIADLPTVQKKMQEEVDAVTCGQPIKLEDRTMMPYSEAVILETIRCICTPIVPHVASQDTTVCDFEVKKGTLVFLNNYTLNMSNSLWENPELFKPERFITEDGRLLKPEHFLPFGGGRRSCMGYKMTQFVSFATLATLMQRYNITPLTKIKVPRGNLAVPSNIFKLKFSPR